MFQQGTLFDNRYELIRYIGRGGFAEVWLVSDQLTGLEEVLKIFAPGGGLDEDGLKLFVQELSVVHDIRHSNLLTPKMLGQYENQPYLILPYCPNGSLDKKIGQCSEDEIWKILKQVASGLACLHQCGIVHQDIKPGNVLLDANNNSVITDFGISLKAQSTLRKSMREQANSGTMAYMAPERFSSEPHPIPANDVWSLGAMLFELVEGDVPFGEFGGGKQQAGAKVPEIKALISDDLKRIIYKMLSPNPSDRPTAEQLINPIPQKAQKKQIDKRRIVMWGCALVLTCLIGCGVYCLMNLLNSQSEQSTPEKPTHTINVQITQPQKVQEKIPDNFVLVAGGTLLHYLDYQAGESHYTDVPLDSFYISKYELTQKEFMSLMPDNPSSIKGDSLPVIGVLYAEAVIFCNRLSEKHGYTGFYIIKDDSIEFNPNGNGYRLPTKYEWAYAARDRKEKAYKYASGDNLAEIAWYGMTSKKKVHKVGTKAPNELGIYDMTGNAEELIWMDDRKKIEEPQIWGAYDLYNFASHCFQENCAVSNDWHSQEVGIRLVFIPKSIKKNSNVKRIGKRKVVNVIQTELNYFGGYTKYEYHDLPYGMARIYKYGYGVKQDSNEAERWYRIAEGRPERKIIK